MATLSPKREAWPVLEGLTLTHRGKVRDTYDLGNGFLLVVATDAISVFDFLLNALVPQKGAILTAMSHFWLKKLEEFGIKTHFVAAGSAIDEYLPVIRRGDVELQKRGTVVRMLAIHPAEFVGRVCLAGSVLKEYRETSQINGQWIGPGLQEGDMLPYVLDTPTTKENDDHDKPLNAADMREKYPQETLLLIRIIQIIAAYAKERGILFADTKLEMGVDKYGNIVLGDEVGTPDSSRFWDYAVWVKSRAADVRKAPPPFDKQLVRQWGIEQGVNKKEVTSDLDVSFVHGLDVPGSLITATTQTYRYIFWRLTGMTLEAYQREVLGISGLYRRKRVDVVLGSESDIPAVKNLLQKYNRDLILKLHVISCHRNGPELLGYAHADERNSLDAIVAAGGMALALPGILDAHLHHARKSIPVIGVALGKERLAAELSISELPGQPVVIDEIGGSAYSGPEGFEKVFLRLAHGELPPPRVRVEKPAKFDIDFMAD